MPPPDKMTVFYDGSCPLCHREIAFYRRRKDADRLSWIDVSQSFQKHVAHGLTREAALARFHVRKADGRVVSGGAAFAHLWAALPELRLLGRVFQVRPLSWVLDRLYDLFLHIRPYLTARRQD